MACCILYHATCIVHCLPHEHYETASYPNAMSQECKSHLGHRCLCPHWLLEDADQGQMQVAQVHCHHLKVPRGWLYLLNLDGGSHHTCECL